MSLTFGPHSVRGKRAVSGKTIAFGLFKRDDQVYMEIVTNCKKATLQTMIRGRVSADAVIHGDGWRGYDGLVDVGYSKYYRVNHGYGAPAETFCLHLKECEWRFNHRHDNLYAELLRPLRKHPL